MPRHHFVPISVLYNYATPDAWRLVRAPRHVLERIASADSITIAQGQKRNWPVCVYDKQAHKATRKRLGQICSQARLYAVPDLNDKLTRALIRSILGEDYQDSLYGSFDLERFLQLGEKPLNSEQIERAHVGQLDAQFARLLPILRGGSDIDGDQLAILLRFIAFSRFRTPIWRKVYFPELQARTLTPYIEAIRRIIDSAKSNLSGEWAGGFAAFENLIETVSHMIFEWGECVI